VLRGVSKARVGRYINRRFCMLGGEEYVGWTLQSGYFQHASVVLPSSEGNDTHHEWKTAEIGVLLCDDLERDLRVVMLCTF
jgi:hypothetical protein